MKRPRQIYLSVLTGVIILGILRPGFVVSMLFYMLIFLPIADAMVVGFTFANFRISHRIDQRIIAKGEKVIYRLEIENPTILMFASIRLRYTGRGVLFNDPVLDADESVLLYPFERKISEKILQCDYRGSYYIGVESVRIQGFFRLFSARYRGIETLKILVYPKIHEMKAIKMQHAISDAAESVVSFDKFDQSLFSELRDYQPGDRLNRIHWKLSAGREQWLTKEFEGNVNNKTILMLNTEHLGLGYEADIIAEDYLVEGAVAISRYLLTNGTPIELHTYSQQAELKTGKYERDFYEFYEHLAKVRFDLPKGTVVEWMNRGLGEGHGPCVLMVFSLEVSAELSEWLLRKQRDGYEVTLITAPFEGLRVGEKTLKMDRTSVYGLMDNGIRVFSLVFDDTDCRMEVA